MLVIQQNCRKGYKYMIFALEARWGLNTRIVCSQKLFLEKKNLSHVGFNLYWPAKAHNWKDNRVFIVVKKNLLNKTIMENQMNLVSQLYCIVLDITKREIYAKEQKKKIKIINIYDNKLEEGQTQKNSEQKMKRAIQDIPQQSIIKQQVFFLKDMNAHSPI